MAPARLSAANGFSLEIPDGLSRAQELEAGQVCVAARVEPWQWPESFRPNLTAEVTPLAPDRATVEQLGTLAIATQVTLGAHVAACDVWLEEGHEPGRRITSLYPAMDTTVIQQQYVAIRGGRAVVVSVQVAADLYKLGLDLFGYVVSRIHCEFDDPVPEPDPATMPRIDEFARQQGEELEYLGRVRAAQPFQSSGPPLSSDQLEALRRGKPRRGTELAPLQAAGLMTDRGRLTELGEAARQGLRSRIREIAVEVATDGDPRVAQLHAYQNRESTTVVASPPPGAEPGSGTDADSGAGGTVDVIPSMTTPVALARWVGLAPAWTLSIADGDTRWAEVDEAVLDARLASPDAPVPAGANPVLARFWSEPWQVATIAAGPSQGLTATVITTTEAGSLMPDRAEGMVRLTPYPSASYLRALLRFGGFDLSAPA